MRRARRRRRDRASGRRALRCSHRGAHHLLCGSRECAAGEPRREQSTAAGGEDERRLGRCGVRIGSEDKAEVGKVAVDDAVVGQWQRRRLAKLAGDLQTLVRAVASVTLSRRGDGSTAVTRARCREQRDVARAAAGVNDVLAAVRRCDIDKETGCR